MSKDVGGGIGMQSRGLPIVIPEEPEAVPVITGDVFLNEPVSFAPPLAMTNMAGELEDHFDRGVGNVPDRNIFAERAFREQSAEPTMHSNPVSRVPSEEEDPISKLVRTQDQRGKPPSPPPPGFPNPFPEYIEPTMPGSFNLRPSEESFSSMTPTYSPPRVNMGSAPPDDFLAQVEKANTTHFVAEGEAAAKAATASARESFEARDYFKSKGGSASLFASATGIGKAHLNDLKYYHEMGYGAGTLSDEEAEPIEDWNPATAYKSQANKNYKISTKAWKDARKKEPTLTRAVWEWRRAHDFVPTPRKK